VLAWLVIQVTDTVAPAVNLPEWTLALVIWLGVLGFPFVLIFAWAFELTPEGIKLEKDIDRSQSKTQVTGLKINGVIIALLLSAIAFLIVDNYILRDAPDEDSMATQAQQNYDSIAVLPFENMSNDEDQEYFSDGLTEELLNTLAGFNSLKVAARTSSFAFKGKQPDIREVGHLLGVATVLEGSVRRAGTRLRITAQLIDASNGFHLWSETYDRELTDIFAIQDDIASKIMEALEIHLETGETVTVSSTSNTKAYDHYLKGLQAMHRRTRESIESAQRHFTAATAADPDYAPAWAGQALAVFLLSDDGYGTTPAQQANALSLSLVERALVLEPELAEAHAVVALLSESEYRYDEALASNARAISAKPGLAEPYLWRSNILTATGRIREADEARERAFLLDPLHPSIIRSRAVRKCEFFASPMSEEALSKLEAETEFPWMPFMCFIRAGHYADAYKVAQDGNLFGTQIHWLRLHLKDCEFQPSASGMETRRIMSLVACRKDKEALSYYAELTSEQTVLPYVALEWIAIAQLRQGQAGLALATLDQIHAGQIPVAGSVAINGISSNASLALDRVLARRQLGDDPEVSVPILARVRNLVDNFKAEGDAYGYWLLEAKLLLLEGREAEAIPLIERGAREHEFYTYDRYDPVLLALLGERRINELTSPMDEHVNRERSKLGWPVAVTTSEDVSCRCKLWHLLTKCASELA
jgi:TolB-like protein